MKNMILTLILVGLLAGCNNASQKTLQTTDGVSASPRNLNTKVQVDTSTPKPGVKFQEHRAVDPRNKPITLNFSEGKTQKEFDLANYCSKVSYVHLKASVDAKGQPADRMRKIVCMSDKYIVAAGTGEYPALYCYDVSGKFLFKMRERNKSQLEGGGFKIATYSQANALESATISGNRCMFMTIQGKETRMNWLNLETKQVYAVRKCRLNDSYIIGADKYINNEYCSYGENAQKSIFLRSCNSKGETLCIFKNYNKVVPFRDKNAKSVENGDAYYYNGQLTIRQACNDTVFRVVSENRLLPVYVMDLGKNRIDLNTSLYGDHDSKIIPTFWLETNRCILFEYSFRKMTTRFYYDKASGKIFREAPTNDFARTFWVNNSVAGGLPTIKNGLKTSNSNLYETYLKKDLEDLVKDKMLLKCTVGQKKTARSYFERMGDGDLLVMLLK